MLATKILFWMSVGALAYSYVLYPLLLLLIDKTSHPAPFSEWADLPGVTILIAAYNEERVIAQRIENCLQLDYPADKLQIIVGSDGSSDRTAAIARRFADRDVEVYKFSRRRGKVNVLNELAPRAAHPILVFSDANTMFRPDAVTHLVKHFADPRVACVCGELEVVNADGSRTGDLEGVYWRYETLLKRLEGRRGSLLGANGPIYAIRAALFEPCPADTIVEDFYMPMRFLARGLSVIYEPRAVAVEAAAPEIAQEHRRRVRIGAGAFQALFRLGAALDPRQGFPALAFWSHKVLRWFAPFFMILAFVANVRLGHEPGYDIWLSLQVAFYLSALVGLLLTSTKIGNRFFNLCYYFVEMNLALLVGFWRYLARLQHVTWLRTER